MKFNFNYDCRKRSEIEINYEIEFANAESISFINFISHKRQQSNGKRETNGIAAAGRKRRSVNSFPSLRSRCLKSLNKFLSLRALAAFVPFI